VDDIFAVMKNGCNESTVLDLLNSRHKIFPSQWKKKEMVY
jgi:hypothetical protein